jgi:hypothetical protein
LKGNGMDATWWIVIGLIVLPILFGIIYGFAKKDRGSKFLTQLLEPQEKLMAVLMVNNLPNFTSFDNERSVLSQASNSTAFVLGAFTGASKIGFVGLTNKRLLIGVENGLGSKLDGAGAIDLENVVDCRIESNLLTIVLKDQAKLSFGMISKYNNTERFRAVFEVLKKQSQ